MEDNRKHIDKLFSEGLGNYTETPAPDVWASLNEKLDDHYKTGKLPAPKPGPSYGWLWYVLLGALVAALITYLALSGEQESSSENDNKKEATAVTTGNGYVINKADDGKTVALIDGKDTADVAKGSMDTSGSVAGEVHTNNAKTGDKTTVSDKTKNKPPVTAKQKPSGPSATRGGNITASTAGSSNKAQNAGSAITSKDQPGNQAATPKKKKSREANDAKAAALAKTKKINTTSENELSTDQVSNTPKADNAKTSSVKPQRATLASGKNIKNHKQQDDEIAGNKVKAGKDDATAKSDVAGNQNDGSTSAEQKSTAAAIVKNNKARTKKQTTNTFTPDEPKLAASKPAKSAIAKAGAKPGTVTKTRNNNAESIKHADTEKQVANNLASGTTKQFKTNPSKAQVSKTDTSTAAGALHASKATSLNKRNKSAKGVPKPASTSDPLLAASAKTASLKDKAVNNAGAGASAMKSNQRNNKVTTTGNNVAKKTATEIEDEGPSVSFGNNVSKNKTNEPVVAKKEDNPDVNWQKGFKADDSRGLKDVKAGNQVSGGGADDEEEAKPMSGSGGGGATAGFEDKKQKKKSDKESKKTAFDFGAKVGYEKGFGSYQSNKFVFAPFLQYNLASNISLVVQPSVKYGRLNKTDIGDPQSWYRITGSSLDSNHIPIPAIDSFAQDSIRRRYYFTQSHDSITTSKTIGKKTYFEFELPVMLQYKITKGFNVYGGLVMNYSKVVQLVADERTFAGNTKRDSLIFQTVPVTATKPVVPSVSSRFSYTLSPYSQYQNTPLDNATSNPFRFSYTIGFNVLFNNRFIMDVMFMKMFSNAGFIPNTHVRELYSQGYFRLSVGYKLSK